MCRRDDREHFEEHAGVETPVSRRNQSGRQQAISG
jgi:hypothetical protein